MTNGKNIAGFMPRRIVLNSVPSSYSLKVLMNGSKLDLEKIWEAKARENEKVQIAEWVEGEQTATPGVLVLLRKSFRH